MHKPTRQHTKVANLVRGSTPRTIQKRSVTVLNTVTKNNKVNLKNKSLYDHNNNLLAKPTKPNFAATAAVTMTPTRDHSTFNFEASSDHIDSNNNNNNNNINKNLLNHSNTRRTNTLTRTKGLKNTQNSFSSSISSTTTTSPRKPTPNRHFSSTQAPASPKQPETTPPAVVSAGDNVNPLFSEGGLNLARSRTNLVEVINGRSKRWLFDPKNKKKLHPQWMWHDDEETFDKMLAGGRGRAQAAYHDIINTARSFAYSVLLPAGYPDSVHGCYSAFSRWQFLETSFNQFIHVLCSQAMLSCVGLPTDTASTAGGAVAIKWIAKDGIAHFSKLFFTKKYAYQLDFRPKTWGLVSELLFLFGSAFELSTAILAKYNSPEWFLPLAALGASLQSVAHLAWEATHATFNKYLSLRNNLADVTAKADSQMVMSELLGMSLGLFYINYFNEPSHLWAAFLLALPLHIGSTVGRLKSIKFGKLSSSRLLQHYNSYVQHRLGPTRLVPGVSPEDLLGATAEHIAPEIYTNKAKRIEYIKEKMARGVLYNQELDAARNAAAAAAAAAQQQAATGTNDPVAEAILPTVSLQSAKVPSVTPVLPKLPPPPPPPSPQSQPQATATQPHLKKQHIDPYQEIQALQQIMNFATPEQFHYTDRKLGEWFDTKAWIEIYGYPKVEMCAPIDEAFETEDELLGAVALFRNKHYLVNYRPSTNKIYLSFEEECEHDDIMQSLLVATRLAYDIRKNGPPVAFNLAAGTPIPVAGSNEDLAAKWAPFNMVREALQWALRYEDQIDALLAECDWDVDELTWPDTGTRVYWEITDKPQQATTPPTTTTTTTATTTTTTQP